MKVNSICLREKNVPDSDVHKDGVALDEEIFPGGSHHCYGDDFKGCVIL